MLSSIRYKARCLLALPLLCWALSSHAQSRLAAEDAVALALSQPHVPQALDAGVAAARSDLLAARTWTNPGLTLSQERGNLGPLGETRESSAMLSQEFELGGRRALRRQAAELGVVAASLEAKYTVARLRAEVLRAYSDAVAGELRREGQTRAAGNLRTLAEVAARRQRSGDLSGYESRRIVQAGQQAQARAAEADAEARAARARLAGLVGEAALDAELDALPPLPALPAPTDELRSAELDVLDARREQALAAARAERRNALPLTVGIGTKRIEEFGSSERQLLLELGVPLPLFDRNQAARARTTANADQAEAAYHRALLATRGRHAAARESAERLSASARRLLETTVPEAARLTEIACSSFAEGELDLVGLLDAHAAESDVLQQALDQQSRALDALLELQMLSPLSHSHPATDPHR